MICICFSMISIPNKLKQKNKCRHAHNLKQNNVHPIACKNLSSTLFKTMGKINHQLCTMSRMTSKFVGGHFWTPNTDKRAQDLGYQLCSLSSLVVSFCLEVFKVKNKNKIKNKKQKQKQSPDMRQQIWHAKSPPTKLPRYT